MTQVTKIIRSQKYLYFQDSCKINGKYKVINTLIARNDVTGQELLRAREDAISKHILKILKARSMIKKTPFHFENITTNDTTLLEDSLEFVKQIYNVYRKSLTPQELENFEKILFVKYVHGTTAIEGNTLTEDETFRLLSTDLTPANKTINETIEVANYNMTRAYLESYNGLVTEKLIRRIHALLMNRVTTTNSKLIDAGNYRTNQAILVGVGFKPVQAEVIEENIKYLLQEYYSNIEKNIHPIELASYFHQKFEEIHPFQDGNGRVGREILNYMLEQNGFPPIYILQKHRSEYLTALQKGNENDYDPLFALVCSRISGTILYIQAKTSIYSQIVSEKTKKIAIKMGAEDIYESLSLIVAKQRDTEELP